MLQDQLKKWKLKQRSMTDVIVIDHTWCKICLLVSRVFPKFWGKIIRLPERITASQLCPNYAESKMQQRTNNYCCNASDISSCFSYLYQIPNLLSIEKWKEQDVFHFDRGLPRCMSIIKRRYRSIHWKTFEILIPDGILTTAIVY